MTEQQYNAELAKADRIEAQDHHLAAYLAAEMRREAFARLVRTTTDQPRFEERRVAR